MVIKPAGFSYQKWDYLAIQDDCGDNDTLVEQCIFTNYFDIKIDTRTNITTGQMAGGATEENSERLGKISDECRTFISNNIKSEKCIYCQGLMRAHDEGHEDVFPEGTIRGEQQMSERYNGSAAPTLDIHSEFEQSLSTCEYCSWWKIGIRHKNRIINNNSERGERRWGWDTGKKGVQEDIRYKILAYGKMKEFDISATDTSLEDLRAWLSKHPDHVYHVDPFKFEELLVQCLKSGGQYAEVRKIGGRKDRGVDILLIDTGGNQTLVQVKRRNNRSVETVDTIRSLNGVLLREGIPSGMVITTAGRFTQPAKEETNIYRSGLYSNYRVDLHSYEYVEALLRSTYRNKSDPWTEVPNDFKNHFAWLPRERIKHSKRRA